LKVIGNHNRNRRLGLQCYPCGYKKPIYIILNCSHAICKQCTYIMIDVQENEFVIKCYCTKATRIDINPRSMKMNQKRYYLVLSIFLFPFALIVSICCCNCCSNYRINKCCTWRGKEFIWQTRKIIILKFVINENQIDFLKVLIDMNKANYFMSPLSFHNK
jgi:hypothetical protein